LHVRGEIVVKSSGEALKKGDKLDSEAQIAFKSKDAVAALFSSEKGRFTLSPAEKGEAFGEEFIAYVKSSVLPSRKGLSARAGKVLLNEMDIRKYFGKDRMVILQPWRVTVSEEAYTQTNEGFFYMRYYHDPQTADVNKKISWEGDEMLIDFDDILMLGREKTDPKDNSDYQLFYFKPANKHSKLFCYVHPIFPDIESLKDEVKTLLELETARRGEALSREETIGEVDAYLQEYYGWPDPTMLNAWMDAHFPE
ncbi:MAG: hypothetical protein AAF570_27370, partial [Bacteroidota bacterium]